MCIGIPNEKSISFHKRMGFEEAGLFRRAGFKRGRWVDSLWLQKFLPEGGEDSAEGGQGQGGHPSAQAPYTESDRVLPEPVSVTALSAEEVLEVIARSQSQTQTQVH